MKTVIKEVMMGLLLVSCVENASVREESQVCGTEVHNEQCVDSLYDSGVECNVKVINGLDMRCFLSQEEKNTIRKIESKFNHVLLENIDVIEQYTYSFEDYERITSLELKVFNEVLMRYGYKTPSEDDFLERIKRHLGVNPDQFYFSEFYPHNLSFAEDLYIVERCMKISTKYRLALFTHYSFNTFFSFERKIDTIDAYGLDVTIHDVNSDIVVDIKRIETEIYANLFLFNDSKSAKVWLINNDLQFFDEIRHYEDREVNERKLSNYLAEVPNEYDDYDVSLHVNEIRSVWKGQDILNLVYEKTDSAIVAYEEDKKRKMDIKAFDLLAMYLLRYCGKRINEYEMDFVELICRFAKMEVSLNKKHAKEECHGYFNVEGTSISYNLLNDKVMEFAKEENYFGIEGFDEVLKVVEWDRVHDPRGSNEYEPFDYRTLNDCSE